MILIEKNQKSRGITYIFSLSLFVYYLLISPVPNHSHPHMFLESTVNFRISKEGLEGIELYWTFDPFFSQMIISDFDRDKNGVFSSREMAQLKSGAFDNLKNFNYFTILQINGKRSVPDGAEEFKAEILKNNILAYHFFIPFKVPVRSATKEIRVTVYDDTYYVSCQPSGENRIKMDPGASFLTSLSLEESTIRIIYPGQTMPRQVVLRIGER